MVTVTDPARPTNSIFESSNASQETVASARHRWRNAGLISLVMLIAFALLARDELTPRTFSILLEYRAHAVAHSDQAPPFAGLLYFALRWLDLSLFTTVRLISALCVAVAVGIAYLTACRLTRTPRHALMCAGICASFPATWFGGVLATDQGPGILGTAIAFLTASRYVTHPSHRRAVLVGVATGFAAWCHVSAVLLPLPLGVMLWFTRARSTSGRLPGVHISIIITVHAGILLLIDALQPAIGGGTNHFDYLVDVVSGVTEMDLARFATHVHKGFARSLMPASLMLLLAVFNPRMRGFAIALILCALFLLLVSELQMRLEHRRFWTGFALWQLAIPLAALLVRGFDYRVCVTVIGVGVVVSILAILPKNGDPNAARHAEGLRDLIEERPTAILWCPNDLENEALMVHAPDLVVLNLVRSLATAPRLGLRAAVAFDRGLALCAKQGKRLVITMMSMRAIEFAPPGRPLHQLKTHIFARCTVRHVRRGSFRGFVLAAK